MMRARGLMLIATIGALLTLVAVPAFAERLPGSAHGGKGSVAVMTGASETPPNASTATGTARVTVNPGQDEVCWEITFAGLVAPATAAHIHVGPPGVPGPIVIPTPVPAATSATGTGCAVVSDELASAIARDPSAYYVNVHDSVFPLGEIRGQLG
jgi:CHRD domain-containing protein